MTDTSGAGRRYPAIVFEAQIVVSVQARCSLDEAIEILQSTADATDESIETVAQEVVAGTVTFDHE